MNEQAVTRHNLCRPYGQTPPHKKGGRFVRDFPDKGLISHVYIDFPIAAMRTARYR